jgi:hypothetical protein
MSSRYELLQIFSYSFVPSSNIICIVDKNVNEGNTNKQTFLPSETHTSL